MIYDLKYYITININGDMRFLKGKNPQWALVKDETTALCYPNHESAQKAINGITGKLTPIKPYMRVVPDKTVFKFRQDAKAVSSKDKVGVEVEPDHDYSDGDYYYEWVQKECEKLDAKLKECNLECQDLEHYMELRDLDVQRGYKAYKMMHDARKRRREIKDQLLILENIKKMILNTESAFKQRTYTPRVRTDIQYTKEQK